MQKIALNCPEPFPDTCCLSSFTKHGYSQKNGSQYSEMACDGARVRFVVNHACDQPAGQAPHLSTYTAHQLDTIGRT